MMKYAPYRGLRVDSILSLNKHYWPRSNIHSEADILGTVGLGYSQPGRPLETGTLSV